MKNTLTTFCLIAVVGAGSAEAGQAVAAAKADALDGWLGCWRLEDDLAGTGARLCVSPEKSGVRLQTLAGKVQGADEVIIPDGAARPIADSECQGTERSEWSSDGQRVFRSIDVTCKDEAPRAVKGVMFLASTGTLVNVQHVSGAGTASGVRVQRYRRAQNQTLADGSKAPQPKLAGRPVDATWSIEDVIEASGKLPAEAPQLAGEQGALHEDALALAFDDPAAQLRAVPAARGFLREGVCEGPELGFAREIVQLVGIGLEVEELRRIAGAGDVFVAAPADHENGLGGPLRHVFGMDGVRP